MGNKKPVDTKRDATVHIGPNTPFHIVEAYKLVRTNLLFALATQKSKGIVVSSALPGEGKSTTCMNLGITLAQTGAKVLLMDGDLRKPSLHKLFSLPNHGGFSNLLVGFKKLEDVIHPKVEPGLDLLTSGTLPPNPSELLGSTAMQLLLEELSQRYDYILMDSPPVNVVADAVILSHLAAGILLVARQNYCTYRAFEKAVYNIQLVKGNILGVILNGGPQKKAMGYQKYGY